MLLKEYIVFWVLITLYLHWNFQVSEVSQVSRDFIKKSRSLARLEKCETLSSLILDYLVCILKCFLPSVNIGRYITILVTAVTKIVRLLIKFLRFSQSAVTNMVR